MAKHVVKKGDTSRIEYVWISDSASTVGAGKTGLAFNSAGLTAYYVRTQGTATAITLVTQTVTGAYVSGGFVEVDATNMPGLYRFDPPDACFATGADKVVIELSGASGMAPVVLEYQLVDYDPEDAAGLGLSRLDAAVGSRLAPTVAGRTLDVSATGEAGVDWANVGSPATSVNLSGTTVGTVSALGAGSITATVVATGAIDADALATDAVAEIADGVWDEARSGHVAAGTFGEGVASVQGNVTGSVGSLGATAKSDVKAEVVNALTTDTYAEPASVPAATSSLKDKIGWLFTLSRNKKLQTATTQTLRDDADAAAIATSAVSDDGTTATIGEWA